jgi:DNA (cytosine-5)-methyltransferase 1
VDERPTFGSLFAGIGGIDLGLERADWECRFQVEWDPFCQRVLAKHWPDVPRYGDITTVDWSGVERVDLLAGGFPCQPVSVAGKRRGQDDDRWLWPEFARAIRDLRPRLVLVENVPGLLIRGMGDVQWDLAQLGYRRGWGVLSAADAGAPHLRRRVWIVAHADGDEYQGATYAKWWAATTELFADANGPDLWDQSVSFEWGIGSSESRLRASEGERPGRLAGGGSVQDSKRAGLERYECSVLARSPAWRPDPDLAGSGWWATEPDVGRVAHGVPARVDRLRSLGNAVVPQVVEYIGRRLIEAEALTA